MRSSRHSALRMPRRFRSRRRTAATRLRSSGSSTSSASLGRAEWGSVAPPRVSPPAQRGTRKLMAASSKDSTAEVRELVARAQAGDRDSLEELYLLHFDRIYSYLHMSVGNRHDAEDLTTQVFVKMLESVGKFRWRSAPFSAWLFRIAHNLAMDHFRANRRWQPEEEVPEPDPGDRSAAEDEALESIGRESMLEMIGKLSHEQQQVLTLKFVFNFSSAEAATILD